MQSLCTCGRQTETETVDVYTVYKFGCELMSIDVIWDGIRMWLHGLDHKMAGYTCRSWLWEVSGRKTSQAHLPLTNYRLLHGLNLFRKSNCLLWILVVGNTYIHLVHALPCADRKIQEEKEGLKICTDVTLLCWKELQCTHKDYTCAHACMHCRKGWTLIMISFLIS